MRLFAFDKPKRPSPEPGAGASGEAALARAWPGPCFRIGFDGAVRLANEEARALLAERTAASAWWDDLCGWLVAGAGELGPFRTSVIDRPDGVTLIEWTVVPGEDDSALLLGRDVTVERTLRDALVDSRQRLRDLIDLAADLAWETDAGGRFAFVAGNGLPGCDLADLVGRPASDLLAEGDITRSPFETRRRLIDAPLDLLCRGAPVVGRVTARPLTDAAESWSGARGVWRMLDRPAS